MQIKQTIKRMLVGLPIKIKVGKQYVGPGEPVFIIAEVGINHNGEMAIAKQLIDAAQDAGAHAVKFQKRTIEDILTKEGLEKPYTSPHAFAPTYGEHRRKLELSAEQMRELKEYASTRGILFFASVWDKKSADVMEEIGVDAYKIPSADVTNTELLEHVARKNKPVLLSTGMSSEEEIEKAVATVLRHNARLILFHCLSLYPSPREKLNIAYMDVLKERYAPLPVGYSGHEIDIMPTLVAVARGAQIVERHLTLDKTMKGSDHAASLTPTEFRQMTESVKDIQVLIGKREKILYDELLPLREKLAKSLVASTRIPKGVVITAEMLTAKGPGNGVKPSLLSQIVGRKAQQDLQIDEQLPLSAQEWPYN